MARQSYMEPVTTIRAGTELVTTRVTAPGDFTFDTIRGVAGASDSAIRRVRSLSTLVEAAGTAVAGGVRAVTEATVTATGGDIAMGRGEVTAPGIEPDKATRTNGTCTTVSAIGLDLRHKVRREIPHDRQGAAQDRTTSSLTSLAMSIAEMIKARGSKGRKAAGIAVTGSQRINQPNNQANHHRGRVPAIVPQEISS